MDDPAADQKPEQRLYPLFHYVAKRAMAADVTGRIAVRRILSPAIYAMAQFHGVTEKFADIEFSVTKRLVLESADNVDRASAVENLAKALFRISSEECRKPWRFGRDGKSY